MMPDLHVITTMGAGLKESVLQESTIHDFKAGLRGALLCPGDVGYEEARKVWNGMIDRHPAMVVRCTGVGVIVTGVRFARVTACWWRSVVVATTSPATPPA